MTQISSIAFIAHALIVYGTDKFLSDEKCICSMYINSICTAVHFGSLFRFTVQGFKSIDDILYLYFISELITWQNGRIESMCSTSSLYISPMEKLPAFFALWFITWDKKQICRVKQNVLGKCPKYRVKWVRTVMNSTCAVWIVVFLRRSGHSDKANQI